MPPFTSLQLQRHLHGYFFYAPPPFTQSTYQSFFKVTDFPKFSFLRRSLFAPFSSQTVNPDNNPDPLSQSISIALLSNAHVNYLSIPHILDLHFSHMTNLVTPSLVRQTLYLSPESGRGVLGFHQWLVSTAGFKHSDETISFFIDYLGRRKDFWATHELLRDGKHVIGFKSLKSVIDRLVWAGRPTKIVGFFDRMERDYGLKRDRESLTVVVKALSENGYASYAERMVKGLANEIFPDQTICDLLIKGWCVDGKLDEAKRLAGEMYRGGFEIGSMAFNAILYRVCKLCREKDPFKLQDEAGKVLIEMDTRGVPRNVETVNVLINNLCKLRRTQDALNLFHRMNGWGCAPDENTYLILIKSLYQAARTGEGDEMIDRMKSAGFGSKLDKKAYYSLLRILCGIQRLEHAMGVFEMMKADGCKPGLKTYDLLIGEWIVRNRLDKGNALYNEASSKGLHITPKDYIVEEMYLKKPAAMKKEKKRETMPEKKVRKRRRLKQIRLSFVKKPKRRMR